MANFSITSAPATIQLSFATATIWKEINQGKENIWIQYPNEHGFTTTEKVGLLQLAEYINPTGN